MRKVLNYLPGVAASLILAEIAIRLLGLAPRYQSMRVSGWKNEPEKIAYYRLSANPKIVYEPVPGVGAYNEEGYLGKLHQLNDKKKRIMILGDSVAFGYDSPWRENIGFQLEKQFSGKIDVFNFAVPGYGLVQLTEILKEKAAQVKPHLILLAICINDFYVASRELALIGGTLQAVGLDFRFLEGIWKQGPIAHFFMNFALFRFVLLHLDSRVPMTRAQRMVKQKENHVIHHLGEKLRKNPLINLLEKIEKLGKTHNIKFVFLPHRGDYTKDFDEFESSFKQFDISYFNLHGLLKKNIGLKGILPFMADDVHYNNHGAKQVGKMIYEYLKQEI